MRDRELPPGRVTFVFTDLEGSTRRLAEVGPEAYGAELIEHRRTVRGVVAECGGVEVETEGDAFFLVFVAPDDALRAAERIQLASRAHALRVRVGVHTGDVLVIDNGYVGLDVHVAARICAAAHGGQILVSEATSALVGVQLSDVGAHRLKDLSAAQRLFQVGEEPFPPPRALGVTNLPVQAIPLLGRDEELASLLDLAGRARLITLTGPGGVGKTSLALGFAAALAETFRDGVWWVPLASITDPDLVLPTVAGVLGAQDLGQHLTGKRMVLLLDNLEQVLDAAPQVGELVRVSTELLVVVTSRERLGLPAEHEFAVEPLDVPSARELFVTRARQLRPAFMPDAAVDDICERLDRLPLALEIAATRTKLLSSTQILERLDHRLSLLDGGGLRGVPNRHSTLRLAISWSDDLLSEDERAAFHSLGVFPSSFDQAAAESIAGASLDVLSSLLDKSLVRRREDGRCFLLETTREYALAELRATGRYDAILERLALRTLRLTQVEPVFSERSGYLPWPEYLWAEIDNMRLALRWSLEHDLAAGIALAHVMMWGWRSRGWAQELADWAERAVTALGEQPPAVCRDVHMFRGSMLWATGRAEASLEATEVAVAFAESDGDLRELTRVLYNTGLSCSRVGDLEAAVRYSERALGIAEKLDLPSYLAMATAGLGYSLCEVGDLDRAEPMLERAAELYRSGDELGPLTSLELRLGDISLARAAAPRAVEQYLAVLGIVADTGDEQSLAYVLAGLASSCILLGDLDRAGLFWAMAETIEAKPGLRIAAQDRERYERIVHPVVDDPAFASGYQAATGRIPADVMSEVHAAGAAGFGLVD